MRQRLVSIWIIGILVCYICGCAQTIEEITVAEPENMEAKYTETESEGDENAENVKTESVAQTDPITDAAEQEEQIADSHMLQEEPDPEKEIEYDGLNTYLPILAEYEKAWEDESYTVREWDKVSSTFSPVNGFGSRDTGYELYYSLADLTGDGTEELIIGLLWEGSGPPEYYLPYLIYAYDTEKKTVVEAENVSFLNNIEIPRPLYENGIIEIYYSTVRSRNYRFYQLQKNSGDSELIGEYTEIYYNESIDNDDEPAFYKGSEYSGEKISEEEYRDAIDYYKSMPQIELEWHELDGFWDPEKESYIDTEQVISDFLSMDVVEFQESYDKDDLYQSGILYCDHDAWKYDGNQVDAFQEPGDYYDVANITAIRFYKEQLVPVYLNMNINDQIGQYEEKISIDYHTDYAVSIYSMPADNGLSCIQEISYVKIELYSGTAPEDLYHFIEGNYYKVREELKNEPWILSPDGDKAACVSNGGLPKHPSQIFVWQGDDKPLTVFRETWELRVVGWIDDDHLVCDKIDIAHPVLVHLERNEIEKITEERKFDTDGVKYSIQGNDLIAIDYDGEQIYLWRIQKKDGEIYIAEPD